MDNPHLQIEYLHKVDNKVVLHKDLDKCQHHPKGLNKIKVSHKFLNNRHLNNLNNKQINKEEVIPNNFRLPNNFICSSYYES